MQTDVIDTSITSILLARQPGVSSAHPGWRRKRLQVDEDKNSPSYGQILTQSDDPMSAQDRQTTNAQYLATALEWLRLKPERFIYQILVEPSSACNPARVTLSPASSWNSSLVRLADPVPISPVSHPIKHGRVRRSQTNDDAIKPRWELPS
jgi:hypothetical protein